MTKSKQIRLFGVALAGVTLAGLAGCSTMQVVEKNIEEGRFVPREALTTGDFLNEYRHPLPAPRSGIAGLSVTLAQRNVLAQGGKVLVQVGISTSAPTPKALNVHALVFVPSNADPEEAKRANQALNAMRARLGRLTVDFVESIASVQSREPTLLDSAKSKTAELKAFLTQLARRPFADGDHHVVLLVGSYKGFLDLPGVSERDKQDIVDLGRILAAKSVTLSVLSIGGKPDFGFLKRLADTGKGGFNVATASLDYDAWVEQDISARSAETLTHVELVLKTKDKVRIARVLSPGELGQSEHAVKYTVPALKQGEQRVLLVELKIPPKGKYLTQEVLDVNLRYFHAAGNRFENIHQTADIQYVYDPNQALARGNDAIERSLLILKTQETLRNVVGEIRARRNFQAIALLTEQGRALQRMGNERQDRELLRDAEILNKYSDRLYEFDGEWIQAAKIWRDLSWDNDRFRDTYR